MKVYINKNKIQLLKEIYRKWKYQHHKKYTVDIIYLIYNLIICIKKFKKY